MNKNVVTFVGRKMRCNTIQIGKLRTYFYVVQSQSVLYINGKTQVNKTTVFTLILPLL